MIVTSGKIAMELAELGCQSIQPPRDDSVYCPTTKWLDEFGAWFLEQPSSKPMLGKRDCEDMTTSFIKFASDALVANNSIKEDVGHSVGWGKVLIPTWLENGDDNPGLNGIVRGETNGVHMTAIVRCSDNQYWFYEPQMTRKELIRDAVYRGLISAFFWAWP